MRLGVVLQLCPLVIHETGLSRQFRRRPLRHNNNASSATFLLRFFLLHAALKSHLFTAKYPSEIHSAEGGQRAGFEFGTPLGETEADERPRTGYGAGSQSLPQKPTVILFGDEAS